MILNSNFILCFFSQIVFFIQIVACSGLHDVEMYWFAPFFSVGGYSSEALTYVDILSRQNIKISAIQHGDSLDYNFMNRMTSQTKKKLESLSLREKPQRYDICICHSEPGAWHAPTPKYNTERCPPSKCVYKISRTMFETDRIPSGWATRVNDHFHELWVPTSFSYNIFVENGVDARKIRIVPEAVDTSFYSNYSLASSLSASPALPHSLSPLSGIPSTSLKFLFVGKWEFRKGIHILLRAFGEEFIESVTQDKDGSTSRSETEAKEVILVIVTSAYHSTNDFMGEIRKLLLQENLDVRLLDHIVLLGDIPEGDMPVLYRLVDVLVIPSYGEGWGRPHVEAMACGTPVIATNWSGPTAYLTEDNGYPLRYTQLVEAKGWKGHYWAEPSVDHLRQLMRFTYNNRSDVILKGHNAREDMVKRFSYDQIGKLMKGHHQRMTSVLRNFIPQGSSLEVPLQGIPLEAGYTTIEQTAAIAIEDDEILPAQTVLELNSTKQLDEL